jgi:hypothetical protein
MREGTVVNRRIAGSPIREDAAFRWLSPNGGIAQAKHGKVPRTRNRLRGVAGVGERQRRATNTYSRLSSANGSPAKPP